MPNASATPESLSPPSFSSISDIRSINSGEALEVFASALADVVAGPEGRTASSGALVATIHIHESTLEDLAPPVQRALVIYTMAANGGMAVDGTQQYLKTHWQAELAEFISASVHSLIGRLFAIKAIEDSFCIATEPPLIPPQDWVFHTDQFNWHATTCAGESDHRCRAALPGQAPEALKTPPPGSTKRSCASGHS